MGRLRVVRTVLVALVTVASAGAFAQPAAPALPAGMERVTSVEGITEYRLANGLKVLLFPDPSKATITVSATYFVGSKHESYGETGMAHLLEHLLFKGSTRHPDIPKELRDHGARPNGTTGYDRTNYFETFDGSDANLEWALDLESDRMVNSFVAKRDLDSEMTVVRNELESSENNPLGMLIQRVSSTAFLWHGYGRPIIGARSDIENVPIERLQAFYRMYYQPDNAMLVVAGRFDEARTLGLVAKYFGVIRRPQRALPSFYTVEPTQDGERSVVLRRVGNVQNLAVAYHVPPGSHADFPALQLLSQVLTHNPSGRLYKALVEAKKASQVGWTAMQLRDAGLATVISEVRKESSLDEARDTVFATIDGLRTTPITSEEVERARTRLLTAIDLQLNNSEQVALGLSNWAGMGDWRLLFLNRDRLRAVTVADVQRVALYYTKPSNRTVGLFIPEEKPDRAEIAAAPDVVALFKDYKGGTGVSLGEAFEASPENIESRVRRTTTPSGLRLIVLPKETRGDAVVATLTMRFGNEQNLMGLRTVGSYTAQMLMRGSTSKSRQQIQDELSRLRARMGIGGSATGVTVSIETVRDNLPAVLALAMEVLRQPAFPPEELEIIRQQALAGLEGQKTEPQAIVPRALQRHMNGTYPPADVRYVGTIDEDIASIRSVTIDELRTFHSTFYGASNGELSVVGDFDPESVQRIVREQLDGWKSPQPYARMPRPYRSVAPVNQVIETPDKANAIFVAGLPLNISDEHPDYAALTFANYLFGSSVNSRLFARIRGKEGLSYGVGSGLGAGVAPDGGTFSANAISAPENAAKVEAAFRDELAAVLRDGFTEAEIDNGKKSWLQGQQMNRTQDTALASRLAFMAQHNRTMAWDAELQKRVLALTGPQIREALRRHIDPAAMTVIKGGDFRKVQQ